MIHSELLPWVIILYFLGGLAAWISEFLGPRWPRLVALAVLLAEMGMALAIWRAPAQPVETARGGTWLLLYRAPWIPQFGADIILGIDGITLLLLLLSDLLGLVAVLSSWNSIRRWIGFFHFNLLWCIAAFASIFMALDLFLFYVSWEIMLVPLYFLIAIWGYPERRVYAAVKFFIFTQVSGLLMLVSILGLYFVHGRASGVYTFDYFELLSTPMAAGTAFLLMLGFFVAFGVKLPLVPLHTWLPDAHTEGPTAASVILAGLVLKVGAYGFLRFLFPLFPGPALAIAPLAMILGVVSILYGAALCFAQRDLKRLVAYSSISHMGFVLLGIFVWNQWSLQGTMIIMLAHGLSTGGLFVLVGDLSERIHTRDMDLMGGFWASVPRMGTAGMILAFASLGLPGLGNFVGEFLVLLGAYRVSIPLVSMATLGFVVATVYSLWIIQRVFHGPPAPEAAGRWQLHDTTAREGAVLFGMIAILLWLGLFPQAALDTSKGAFENLLKISAIARRPPDLGEPHAPSAAAAVRR